MNRWLLPWATGSMRKSSPWQERRVRRPATAPADCLESLLSCSAGWGTHAEPGRVTAEEAAWRTDAEERAPGTRKWPGSGRSQPRGWGRGLLGGFPVLLVGPALPWGFSVSLPHLGLHGLTLHPRSLLLCVRLVVASLLFQSCLPASSGAPTETLEKSSRVSTNARSLCLGLTLLSLGHT